MLKNVTFNQFYDDGNNSFDDVACSDGPNGLITRNNWTTLGQASGFPNIGGVFAVEGFDSDNCGTCWELTFGETMITVLAVDTAPVGFDISLQAMNALTNGNAEFFGRVLANATQVDVTSCEQAGSKSLPPSAHHG
ncbi:Cerato-platanin-domain-containing protein [Dichomitus squalens]|uniref:Cerato-platanin-domain-containing protein n=1 Tax=Dichomitus squalens TaxID=114155 RepID=A0A4Q9NNK6_9APHY|nr:Cerato-platanin-domain-containing protein [Dichomitus squalens]TBU57039.1 Cerato-platanin-domain-containing protein [Dichomitus squalens]